MIPIPLDQVINAIKAVATPVIKNKLERNELVIKLLKQFNLAPEHPPADFSGVYAYALVQYGVGKPEQILELSRQKEIQKAFRQTLDQNNPSILFNEAENFLDWHNLGDEIRDLEIDRRREFYEFILVFIEVAKRTRTPAEVLTNQQLDSLHRSIRRLQERLDRLPTLEGMLPEMARLTANVETRNWASVDEKNCRAIALAQQMRGSL